MIGTGVAGSLAVALIAVSAALKGGAAQPAAQRADFDSPASF
jgi:hypothetical protein